MQMTNIAFSNGSQSPGKQKLTQASHLSKPFNCSPVALGPKGTIFKVAPGSTTHPTALWCSENKELLFLPQGFNWASACYTVTLLSKFVNLLLSPKMN